MPVSDQDMTVREERFRRHLARRRRENQRFRIYGILAIGFAASLLVVLLTSIVWQAHTAFSRHSVAVTLPAEELTLKEAFDEVSGALYLEFSVPYEQEGGRDISRIVSPLAVSRAVSQVKNREGVVTVRIPLSDHADLYLKGREGEKTALRFTVDGFQDDFLTTDVTRVKALMKAETGDAASLSGAGSLLVQLRGGTYRLVELGDDGLRLEPLIFWHVPDKQIGRGIYLHRPESQRTIRDLEAAVLEALKAKDTIRSSLNTALFSQGDSNEAELAGVIVALIGSVFIVISTMALAIPVGVAAAVYLEEFAPRTALTRFITVNINNLASVPSIVFGLLGAAVLINGIPMAIPFTDITFRLGGGMGRGWPLVGGAVLALMALPTVIIASRSAISSVSNSVREAAFSLGASRVQMVAHHVLPQAAPGILTGAIISLARTMGETAPLLLLGMFAFVASVPEGLSDRSTALPVLIYSWSTRAERAWEPMTAAAIVILLLIMVAMNALSIWIRMKFENKNR